MAIVEEPCNVNAHADILALFMTTAVCTHVLYTLIVTVQLSFLSDRPEHRIHPGDTTHHTESNVELWFPDSKTHPKPKG